VIISFAQTTGAFRMGRKSVTRRDWMDRHARHFVPGSVHSAWDKSPRNGGKKIGEVRIVSLEREPLQRLHADPEYALNEWIREGGVLVWPTVEAFLAHPWQTFHGDPYRVEFAIIGVMG